MGRPKGSKNKPKITELKDDKKNPFAWNETIQKMSNGKNNTDEEMILDLEKEVSLNASVSPLESFKLDMNDNTSVVKSESLEPRNKRKDKNKLYCDRCGEEVLDSLNVINLTYLTGKASWFRQVKNDRPKLCHKCCKELNDLIDNWLISGGCESKWDN